MASNVLGIKAASFEATFAAASAPRRTRGPGVPLTLTVTLVNSNNSCAPFVRLRVVSLALHARWPVFAVFEQHPGQENCAACRCRMRMDSSLSRRSSPAATRVDIPTFTSRSIRVFDLATLYTNRVLTSQLALPRDICSSVYSAAERLFGERFEPLRSDYRERQRVRRQHLGPDGADDGGGLG